MRTTFFRALAVFGLLCLLPAWAFGAEASPRVAKAQAALSARLPSLNAEKQWRVAYVEGGSAVDYVPLLHATVNALQTLGLRKAPLPLLRDNPTVESLWAALAKDTDSRLRFLADGFYSGGWDRVKRAENKAALQKRLAEKKDVDIILAFGTPGGMDMAQGMAPVPVLVMSVTDPVRAGIIASTADSGRDNVHVSVENIPRLKQLRFFHELFKFRTLGLCYENSKEGRAIVGYDELRSIAKEVGFDLVEGLIQDFSDDEEENISLRAQCHRGLAAQVQAFYLTVGNGNGRHRYKELLAPLLAANLPTFSQSGRKDVEAGALLSFSDTNMEDLGFFHARVIQQVLQGKKPRNIHQVYNAEGDMALNIRNAATIGWQVTPRVLAAVDEVYVHIQNILPTTEDKPMNRPAASEGAAQGRGAVCNLP